MAEKNSAALPHIVVIGGGFGGLKAIKALKGASARVTLIDRANHHLFQPLLYQVAMAGLSPAEIAAPLRSIFRKQKNVTVLLDEVKGIDLNAKTIRLLESSIQYDYLIIATGAQTSYFGNDKWAHYAVGLKDLDDAVEIRRRVLLAFEAAERASDEQERARLLTFVVVGGGPTGVELAGTLAELSRFVLAQDFRVINPASTRVILTERADDILLAFPPELRAKGVAQLKALGVEIRTGVAVTDIDAQGVHLGAELIPSATVLWGAGVQATPLTKSLGVELDRGGRVIVEPDLSIPGHPEAFVIGDAAAFLHQEGKLLPGVAPVAMQEGTAAADSIIRSLQGKPREKFHYHDKGNLATIGRSAAVADFGPHLRLSGFFAWLIWLAVHIFFLIGFYNRLVVISNWIWSYFTYKRGARLITGHRMQAGAPDSEQASNPRDPADKTPRQVA